MFPHTITLYNVETRTDPATMRTETVNHITLLKGVLMVPVRASATGDKGYTGAGSVTVYIPFSVSDIDPVTGLEKGYQPPVEWAEDKSHGWTLGTDGKTFLIKGEVVEPSFTRQQLEERNSHVYSVTSVAERSFGPPDMRHWEIGGA